LNPDPLNLPKLDPKDAYLLSDPSTSTGITANVGSGSSASAPLAHVPWLRKTEYISREGISRISSQDLSYVFVTLFGGGRLTSCLFCRKQTINSAPIDISRNAQLRDIEASFTASNDSFDLTTLKHPNKPEVAAVESYPILPDADIWPNQYDLFRFSERPGDRAVDVSVLFLVQMMTKPMHGPLRNLGGRRASGLCHPSTYENGT
jgi:RNA polymerase II-associated factor 1